MATRFAWFRWGTRPEGETGPAGSTYSLELCGGTHVARTGDIGLLVLTGEMASSAGIRRVEALTGEAAYDYLTRQDHRLAKAASVLKARPEEVADRVSTLLDERRKLEAEVAELRKQVALGGGVSSGPAVEEIGDVKLIAQVLPGVSPKDLRGLIDEHKVGLDAGAVVLIADTDGKAAVAAGVTETLLERVTAVDLVRAAVEVLGGKGGGGRPDMAQGGGPNPKAAPQALDAIRDKLRTAVVLGVPCVCADMERRLTIGFYRSRPRFSMI